MVQGETISHLLGLMRSRSRSRTAQQQQLVSMTTSLPHPGNRHKMLAFGLFLSLRLLLLRSSSWR